MESLGKKFKELSISRRVQPEEPTYLLDLSIQTVSGPGLVAVCCSNHSINLHSKENLCLLMEYQGHSGAICGVSFAHTSSYLLFSGSADGTVKTWDVRCPGSEATQVFKSDASHLFCSFDVSCNDVVLCAGTEQLDEDDSFLVFWDARMNKEKKGGVLGVYSESHSDDITQVRFHPRHADRLVSGSTDGLVNVFDLSLGAEEEALLATCNCGSSASSVCWAGKDLNQLLCLTHDEGLHLWDLGQLDTDKPLTLFSAADARNQTPLSNQGGLDYFVGGTWLEEAGHLLVLGGTNRGDIHLLECSEKGLSLLSSPQKGHSAVVRCFLWDSAGEALLTGGEDAQLLLWKPGAEELSSGKNDSLKSASALHIKSRLHKKHGSKRNKKLEV
ncbi:WD repeat-containing protein 89 [Esox lucius]|uniref:WD repeat-containing protein 89 n=1 Tax=Esox lucius TaxID=8010 RepID=A0A3P8ZYV9_ESOLU|nr:WD repeat-containing protein 89 [Esox lucius]